jgi:hypothetical protein
MGIFSILRSPASPALQSATREAADASLQRKLISPELHQRLTDGYIDREDLAQATAALKKSEQEGWLLGSQASDCEHNAWSPNLSDDDRLNSAGGCVGLRQQQDAVGQNSDALRKLLWAADAQAAGQHRAPPSGALSSIAQSVLRWSGVGG